MTVHHPGVRLDPVAEAVAQLAAGRPVVVVDDESRENEGDVIVAAAAVTREHVAFMMTRCHGLICVAMAGEALDRLELGPMTEVNTEHHGTAFTVSVDAARGISTGISASDRALTLRLLAAGDSGPADFVRPGHVFPLRARDGGVLERRGHTEAAVDLCRAAGLPPAGVICEVAGDDGEMLRGEELGRFADAWGMPLISIADLVAGRRREH